VGSFDGNPTLDTDIGKPVMELFDASEKNIQLMTIEAKFSSESVQAILRPPYAEISFLWYGRTRSDQIAGETQLNTRGRVRRWN
jgi:hypothetical protein